MINIKKNRFEISNRFLNFYLNITSELLLRKHQLLLP